MITWIAVGWAVIQGIGTLAILFLQLRLAKHNQSVSLFDKRFDTLKIVSKVYEEIMRTGNATGEHLVQIQEAKIRAQVLFSNRSQQALEEIKNAVAENLQANGDLRPTAEPGAKRTDAAKRHSASMARLVDRFPKCVDHIVQEIRP